MDALTGDEDAQLDFIRFIVTETDMPLPDVAVGWLTALAEPVNPCGQLYAMLSSCCEQLGDAEAAMKYLKKLHKLAPDDAQCCIALARNYAMGCGSRLDYELALRYFQKAANLGDSYGTFMVGLHYYEGLGTRRNFKRAVDYFKRALEMGDTRALYHLGICWPRHVSIWWRVMRNWSARLKLWSSASLPPSIRQKPIQSEAWRWQFVKPKKLPAGDGRKLFLTEGSSRFLVAWRGRLPSQSPPKASG